MSDEQMARELAETLMRHAQALGPLGRIKALTRVLKVLRLVVRIVTAERDRAAFSANAVWPYRRLSKLAEVHVSTMQGWCEAGRKAVGRQEVSRETTSANAKLNSDE